MCMCVREERGREERERETKLDVSRKTKRIWRNWVRGKHDQNTVYVV